MKGANLKAYLLEQGLSEEAASLAVEQAEEDFGPRQRKAADDGLSPMGVYEITGCSCAGVDDEIPWARTKSGEVCDHVGSRVVCLKVTPWGKDRIRNGESHRALFMLEQGGRIVSLRMRAFAKAHSFEEVGSLADFFPS